MDSDLAELRQQHKYLCETEGNIPSHLYIQLTQQNNKIRALEQERINQEHEIGRKDGQIERASKEVEANKKEGKRIKKRMERRQVEALDAQKQKAEETEEMIKLQSKLNELIEYNDPLVEKIEDLKTKL